MITQFKTFENYSENEFERIESNFNTKLKKLFDEFIKLPDNKKRDTLYVVGDFGYCICNDDYDLFKCGNEWQIDVNPHRKTHFFIGYQENVITDIWENLVVLENYILRKLRKYIDIDMSEDDGITFLMSDIPKLKGVQFDIKDIELEMETEKYNL